MIVNAVVAVGLAPFIGFIAAAWGTTIAGWAMTAQLWWGTRHMGIAARADDRLRSRFPRIVLASAVMGVILWFADRALHDALSAHGHRYWALSLLVAIGLSAYGLAALATGAFRPGDFRAGFRRQR